jgi:hypothetical protein
MFQFFTHEWPARVLFDSWTVESWGDYLFYCLLSFLLGLGYELSKGALYKARLGRRLRGLSKVILSTWGFVNMLLVMTFNIGIFSCLLVGHGTAAAWAPPSSRPVARRTLF